MRSPRSFPKLVSSVALSLVLASCGAKDEADRAGRSPATAPSAGATTESGSTAEANGDTAPSRAPAEPASSTSDALIVRGEAVDGSNVAPVVEARKSIELRGALRVERREDDAWTPVDARGLSLRSDCTTSPPTACVPLREGGALRPPAWNGTREHGQCGCEGACRRAEPGEYRFVVETCDGSRAIAGTAFRYGP